MEKRRLGRSELYVSSIAFGAWAIGGWMWGGSDRKDAIDAIEVCLDHGITSIDTAPIYGFGHSERIVGEAIKGKRHRYEVLTKAGMCWEDNKGEYYFSTRDNEGVSRDVYKYSGRDSIISECEQSLKRLGTDYIDLLQIHWPDQTTPIEEPMEAFNILIQQGKIRAGGVSNYSVSQCEIAGSKTSLASNQLPYSMVRREIEKDLVPWCIENRCSIVAYSPLQRGLLTGKISPGHSFAPGDSRGELPHFQEQNVIRTNSFLQKIKPLATYRGFTLAQLVLQWTLQQPGITVVLAGGRNRNQVRDNAKAGEMALSHEEILLINAELKRFKLELN